MQKQLTTPAELNVFNLLPWTKLCFVDVETTGSAPPNAGVTEIAVVKKPGMEVSREELIAFYEGKTAKWQIPDDVVFVEAIPLGATGKILKTRLREILKDYQLPGV